MLDIAKGLRCGTLCKIIAGAILLRMILLVDLFENIGVTSVFGVLTLATLVPGLASVVGLWRVQTWGFVAFYLFGVLLTVLFGVSLIPFVLLWLPMEGRVAGLFAINGIVLTLVALVHWRCRSAGSR